VAADGFYIAPGVEGGRLAVPDRDCLQLTSYSGERRRAGGKPAADAFLDLYERQQIAASILLRGIQGFGQKRRLRTDRSLTLSEDLPLVTVAMDTGPRIEAVLERAAALAGPGLVALERARLLDADASNHRLPAGAQEEEARLSVFFSSHDRVFSVPAFEAICDLLRRRGVALAAAFLGVDGTIGGRRLRGRFLGRTARCR
jgi:PII-like signaling protein